MKKEEASELPCPHCEKSWSVEEVLDASRVSWPPQRWVYFYCPACGEPSHVALSKGHVAIGGIDGAPGPCFFPDSEVRAAGLLVTASDRGVKIRYAGRSWFIKAR